MLQIIDTINFAMQLDLNNMEINEAYKQINS